MKIKEIRHQVFLFLRVMGEGGTVKIRINHHP